MRQGYLLEITPNDPRLAPGIGGGNTSVNFSSSDFNPDIVPASEYIAAISELPTFRRDIFSRNEVGGGATIAQGSCFLANANGELDYLKSFYWHGAQYLLKFGDLEGPLSAFTLLFKGRVEQLLFDFTKIEIRMQDLMQGFDIDWQTSRYAGNGTSTEGTAALLSLPKPIAYGNALNITLVQTSPSLLIYQAHSGGVLNSILYLFDKGVVLTAGANYPDQATMEALAPSAGQYRVWNSGSGAYVRLGSAPVGTITAHTVEGATSADRTVAEVFNRFTFGNFGTPVLAADITALNAKNASEMGIFIGQEEQAFSVMDKIAKTAGAWYGFDRIGQFRLQRFEAPNPAASVANLISFDVSTDAGINDIDIRDFRMLATRDEDKGVTTYQVTAQHTHNNTVMTDNDIAGSVNQSDRDFFRSEWRRVIAIDSTVKNYNPGAKKKEIDLYLFDWVNTFTANATAEAQRVLDLFKVNRDFAEIDVEMNSDTLILLDIGNTVRVYLNRFDYVDGKLMVITGMEYNTATNVLTLALWG